MKSKNVVYKVVSSEFAGDKVEFSAKADAIKHARWQRRCGWTAVVTDMRTGQAILSLSPDDPRNAE